MKGYVSVDEEKGVELFYYFIKSERRPSDDPVLLWLSGDPRYSAFNGLPNTRAAYQNWYISHILGPRLANIVFLDSPVGVSFSFSASPEGYIIGDISSSTQVHLLSKSGTVITLSSSPIRSTLAVNHTPERSFRLITHDISQGIEYGKQLILNLKGYLVGNPATGEKIDASSIIPYAHGVGVMSDQIDELVQKHCEGEDYEDPHSASCAEVLEIVKKHTSKVQMSSILELACPRLSPKPNDVAERRALKAENKKLFQPPEPPSLECRNYGHLLSYYWANNQSTKEALGVKKGSCYKRVAKVQP
ncbi:serine carboxypeptidase-like 18 [Typha latifolia]|uniref:serine carboxypeptidase-like 18 n=1 Tax=Typha latifolia TaxID=4733 RepID=UPI003C2C913E